MAHLYRFFIESDRMTGNPVVLSGPEAHHAVHVVRIKVGETVALFDGKGNELRAQVERVSRNEVYLSPGERRTLPPPPGQVLLASAWLHREKALEQLIRRATEIGITAFHFFRAEHSQRAPRISDKYTRFAIESCKQCGRTWLPAFHTFDSLEAVLEANRDALPVVATPHLSPVPLRSLFPFDGPVLLLTGPEGGFSPAEIALLQERQVPAVSLGSAVLRAEAAALTLATLTLYEQGFLGPLPGVADTEPSSHGST